MTDSNLPTEEKKEVSTEPQVHEDVFYVNSFHVKTQYDNAVGVVEKHVYEYPDGTSKTEDKLKFYRDPKRSFYITLPQYRTHSYKKEFEDLDKCERFVCRDSQLADTLGAALGYYRTGLPLRKLCESPYVYGADVPTEVIIKQWYVHRQPVGKLANFTRGGLDIETEVRGDKRIVAITFISEHHIYTGALRDYCRIHEGNDKFHPATEKDIHEAITRLIGKYIDEYKFEVNFKILEDELSLIKWIFGCIHKEKTNFIGVWNIGFDIPHILGRIKALGGNAEEIMCHPEVPKNLRFVKWNEDRSKPDHFTDVWHWMTIAGYSQFYDSMCLYSRLRKQKGREPSYSLDDISDKELGHGKLHLGVLTNHWYQQTYNFCEYVAYNVNDVLIMQLMEWKNNDVGALCSLSNMSLASQFSKQTVMMLNDAYEFAMARGKCPASSGPLMTTEFDNEMAAQGGTVLPTDKADGTGLQIVDKIHTKTLICKLANDLDVSAYYPTTTTEFNISKEATLATILKIDGWGRTPQEKLGFVIDLCSCLIQPEVSAVECLTKYFGFPNYTEVEEEFEKAFPKPKP